MGRAGISATRRPMTTPRFLVSPDALRARDAVLTGAELHHLRVRRLRAGSELVLCDGLGHEQRGIVTALDRRRAVVRLSPEAPAEPASSLQLVLAQALLKGDKLDLVVEKATELGISALLMFTSARSVAQASPHRQERWKRIARSAAKQCQRSSVPAIEGPIPFERLLVRTESMRLLFWEDASTEPLAVADTPAGETDAVLAAVGPEGGFTAAEAEQARRAGFRVVGLGKRILRAETAALVAVTLCQFLWGDLSSVRE
jgi:16S rRNA (uracil1498-N3)-methyltransferase